MDFRRRESMKKPAPSNLLIRRYEPEWASHLPILSRIMLISRGPVMELGMGIYSTPLLHHFCMEQHRQLYSYENVKPWFDAHQYWQARYHQIEFVEDWDMVPIEKYHWGLVFVDHDAPRRSIDAIRAARYADFVVIHDSNGRYDFEYKVSTVAPFFKYRYTYNFLMNHTDVFSNFIPVHTLWSI